MTRACCEVGENWKTEEFGLKRYGWLGLVEFFGILRFAQDDSGNRQRRQTMTTGNGEGQAMAGQTTATADP
jgi:hypothetical protein